MHMRRPTIAIGAAVCVSLWIGWIAQADIHLPAGQTTGFNWTVTDGAQSQWDINSIGMVMDGSGDAFDGGMRLIVVGSPFGNSQAATLAEAGNEIEIGPYVREGIKAYRRIYVDPELGYCRWIDIFENTTDQNQDFVVRTVTGIGGRDCQVTTSTGSALDQANAWALVAHSDQPDRPAVLMVLASEFSPGTPAVAVGGRNQDVLECEYAVHVAAGKQAAICTFVFQRPAAEALTLMAELDVQALMQKVPPALRRILVNMGAAATSLGTLDLTRQDSSDLIVLQDETTWAGQITNAGYQLATAYGPVDIPADQVIGLTRPDPFAPSVQMVLTSGQILAGELTSGPLQIVMEGGNRLDVEIDKVASASYALSDAKPAEVEINDPVLMLRGGQRLIYTQPAATMAFQTIFGALDLPTRQIKVLRLANVEGGLHSATLTNGTVLSGVLTAEQFPVQLTPERPVSIPTFWLDQIVFPPSKAATPPGQAVIHLNNDNVLVGVLDDRDLTIETDHGAMTVPLRNVASMAPSDDHPPGVFRVTGHDETEILGHVQQTDLSLRIVEGVTVSLHPAHIRSLAVGEAPPPPDPTAQPAEAEPAEQPLTAQQRAEQIRQRIEQAANGGASDEEMQRLVAEYQQVMEDVLREQAEEAAGELIVIEN